MSEDPKGRILLVENDADFRFLIERMLKPYYHVSTTDSMENAKALLAVDFFHLLITDIRLENNQEPSDRGGLDLISDPLAAHTSKLVITAYASFEYAKEALQAAEDIIDKTDVDKLVTRIDWLFNTKIMRNPKGKLLTCPNSEPLRIARHLFPRTAIKDIEPFVMEIRHLLQELFPYSETVRLGQVLWATPERVAMVAHIFQKGRRPYSRIIICGHHDKVAEDRRIYHLAEGNTTATNTHAGPESHHTLHLSAHTYETIGGNLHQLITLDKQYHFGPLEQTKTIFKKLLEDSFGFWTQNVRLEPKQRKGSFRDWIKQYLHPNEDGGAFLQTTDLAFDYLIQQFESVGLQITQEKTAISRYLVFGRGASAARLPHPLLVLEAGIDEDVSFVFSAGGIPANQILTNGIEDSWLTNFIGAGRAPEFRDYLSLEATVRFDAAPFCTFDQIVQFEQKLQGGREGADCLAKPLALIHYLRTLPQASLMDDRVYALGTFYHTLWRLLKKRPEALLPHELMRLAHCMYCGALQAEQLLHLSAPEVNVPPQLPHPVAQVWVDETRHTVSFNGRIAHLSENRFQLFHHLYTHAGEICSRQELGTLLWQDYKDEDHVDVKRLNPLISRTRDQLKKELKCTLIETISKKGYRFLAPQVEKEQEQPRLVSV